MSMTPDTRGRGVRLPRSARRAQLLEAAQEVFVGSGYHAAAMDEIAERAGVSKPVLYQHFPGKLDLYLALLDQHSGELVALVREALASTTDNKQRVAATIAAYFEFVARDGAPFRLVFESDLTNEVAVRERVDKVSQDCAEAIAEVISEDTDLPEAEAHLLGMAMSGHGPGLRPVLARPGLRDPPRRGGPAGRGPVLAWSRRLPQGRPPGRRHGRPRRGRFCPGRGLASSPAGCCTCGRAHH